MLHVEALNKGSSKLQELLKLVGKKKAFKIGMLIYKERQHFRTASE